jgi:hypothetical protein
VDRRDVDYSAPGQVKGKRLRVTKVQPISGISAQTGTGDLNMTYACYVEGKITPQYNYSYDTMMRPAGMTDLRFSIEQIERHRRHLMRFNDAFPVPHSLCEAAKPLRAAGHM